MVTDQLEREAITLIRQYKFLLPAAVKMFLLNLSIKLDWQNLKREL